MKYYLLFCLGAILFSCTSKVSTQSTTTPTKLVELVNPLMGTDSEFKLSNGNTYPAIARPWGMNFWTPQTAAWATDGVTPTIRTKCRDSNKPISLVRGLTIMPHFR